MSEQSELAQAIRENTAAIKQLTNRMEKQEQATTALTTTMERVNVRLASKLDAGEITEFVASTNKRFERIERKLELA